MGKTEGQFLHLLNIYFNKIFSNKYVDLPARKEKKAHNNSMEGEYSGTEQVYFT